MSKHAAIAVVALLGTCLVQAGQPEQPRQIIVIPKTYVSPGASGSIGGFQRYEQHDLINGRTLPDLHRQEIYRSGDYRYEQRGGVRQSTEYPGGLRIERYPGGGGYKQRESR